QAPVVARAASSATAGPVTPQAPPPAPPPPAPPPARPGAYPGQPGAQPPRAAAGRSRRAWMAAVAARVWGVVLGAGGVIGYRYIRNQKRIAPPVSTNVKVAFEASQPGASILVDGQACGSGSCLVSLAAGEHRAEARLDGYAPASRSFRIETGAS